MNQSNDFMYLLYSDATSETGNKIRNVLKINGGYKPPEQAYPLVLNYGSCVECTSYSVDIINDPIRVAFNAQHKDLALIKMFNAGVNVPKVYTAIELIKSAPLPMIARKSFHRSGSGCQICIVQPDILNAIQQGFSHFMPLLPIVREFRVHMFDGIAFLIQEKINTGHTSSQYIRTLSNGWGFRDRYRFNNGIPIQIIHESNKALKALQLSFGAIDIGIDDKDIPYVFEVNTGAGITGKDHTNKFLSQLQMFIKRNYGYLLNIGE